jgi:pimeloyl-ACP methyl ester carboxylesterase
VHPNLEQNHKETPMSDLSYDSSHPLYLPTGARLSIAESRAAVVQAYSSGYPVLVYIHGRAKGIGEPKKSVEEGIYEALGSYGVSVIGFTWDADDGGYDPTRPEAAAEDFDRFLDALGGYLASTDAAGRARPALLAHSMGNIIVSELAKDERLTSERGKLFANIVLSAAAVKSKRHHRWLGRIEASERNYVMVNPDDKALLLAGFAFRPNMLGREVRAPGVSPEQAVYVDLSRLGVNHRYFVPGRQKGQVHLKTFYSQALTGQAVDLDPITDPVEIDGVGLRSIRKS